MGFGAVRDAHLGVGEDDVDGWAQSRDRAELGTLGRFEKHTAHISRINITGHTTTSLIYYFYTPLSHAPPIVRPHPNLWSPFLWFSCPESTRLMPGWMCSSSTAVHVVSDEMRPLKTAARSLNS